MSTMKKRQNRHHPDVFKQEAVSLSNRIGVTKASRQLDLAPSLLYGWRKQFDPVNESDVSDLASENARLKRALADKEEELSIVKKAARYFAQEFT